MFHKSLLRRKLGPNKDEVRKGWRELLNEDINDLCSLSSIIRMIKLRRMRSAGHVARMGEREMLIGYWRESQREGGY
jgi:hypothetical protein